METEQHDTKQPISTNKSKRNLKKYLETNENGNTTVQNLQDAAKAVLTGKFIVI